jgi:hypothetical protein
MQIRRWLWSSEKKECPALKSHTSSHRLSLLITPLLSGWTLPLKQLFLVLKRGPMDEIGNLSFLLIPINFTTLLLWRIFWLLRNKFPHQGRDPLLHVVESWSLKTGIEVLKLNVSFTVRETIATISCLFEGHICCVLPPNNRLKELKKLSDVVLLLVFPWQSICLEIWGLNPETPFDYS